MSCFVCSKMSVQNDKNSACSQKINIKHTIVQMTFIKEITEEVFYRHFSKP